MDKELFVKKFHIVSASDPSVGIFEQWFDVGYDFYFDSETELNEFKEKIKEAFEWVCDSPKVYTQEEIDIEEKRLAKMEEEAMIDYHDENLDDTPTHDITEEQLENEIKKDWSKNG